MATQSLTISRQAVALDGVTAELHPPLDPKEFAEEVNLLRMAANPPSGPEEWKAHREALEKVNEGFLRRFGHQLFRRVFVGPVLDRYRKLRGPIALRLVEDEAQEGLRLADLPWELLFDGRDWLARRPGILRVMEIDEPLPQFKEREGRLKVLVAMASPILNERLEPDDPGQPYVIDLDREAELFRSLEGSDLAADFALRLHVDGKTLSFELGRDYDVFHFLGHGNVGRLALEDRYGRSRSVDTEWLRERIWGSGLRLAVFQSCLTAADAPGVPGVARTLLEAGVPAILAMSQSISVDAARAFFSRFYRELASRETELVEVVRRGRLDIVDEEEAYPWEWATPALFVRADALERPALWRLRIEKGEEKAGVDEQPRSFSPSDPSLQRDPLFTGRRRELVEVARVIDPEAEGLFPVTVIHGERGIGKTALAVEALFRWGWWFKDVQWLRGRGEEVPEELARFLHDYQATMLVESVDEFLHRWATRLKIPLRGDEPPQALVRPIIEALADGKKRLVVLDNMDLFIHEKVVKDILRGLPANCRALVTCPEVPEGLEVNRVKVGGLPPLDAFLLMGSYAARANVALELNVAEEIRRRTDGHPMAMRMVVGWAGSGKRSWEEALAELRKGEREEGTIFDYVFTRSLEMAGEEGRYLFRLLPLFAPVASREAWRAVSGMEPGPFGDAAELLVRLSLVEDRWVDSRPYYALQPLAGAVAGRKLAADPEREDYLERMAGFYEKWVRGKPEPHLLEVEAGNLGTALEWLERHRREEVKPLLGLLLSHLERAWGEGKEWWAKAGSLLKQGKDEKAQVEAARALRAWSPLRGRLVDVLVSFFDLHSYWPQGERLLYPALEVARSLGDRHAEGRTLGNLGIVYRMQGRWDEAIGCYEESLGIFQELGDRHGEGATLTNLGSVYLQQGRWEEAIECYEEDLAICRELGDRHGEGQTLMGLGTVYAQQGRRGEAIECYEESLAIFRELGDRHGEGATLTNLGDVYLRQGRWEEAIECYEKDLAIFRELGDRYGEGQTLGNLANLYAERDELDKALEAAGHALRIFQELKAYPDLVTCHCQMASLSLRAGDTSACFNHLAQALYLALQIHSKLGVETLDDIVRTAKGLGDRGKWEEVAALGVGLHGLVVEMEKEGWKNKELEAVGVLARRVCAVIALAGKSRLEEVPEEERAEAGETALAMARMVDEVTGGVWGLEEWVRESVNG